MSLLYRRLTANPRDREALLLAAQGVQATYTHNQRTIARATHELGGQEPYEVRWGTGIEDSFWLKPSEPDIVILDAGNESVSRLLKIIADSFGQYPIIDGNARIGAFVKKRLDNSGAAFAAAVRNEVSKLPAGRYQNLVLCGHSLGGVEAQAWGIQYGQLTPLLPHTLIVSFGSPVIGNPALKTSVTVPHLRVHTFGDVIPYWPMPVMPGLPLPIGAGPVLTGITYWAPFGRGIGLFPEGQLLELEDSGHDDTMGPSLLFATTFPGTIGLNHSIAQYVNRLRASDVVLPTFFFPISGGSDMATFQIQFFFKHHVSGNGWSEMFYLSNLGADNRDNIYQRMKALANLRAKALGGPPGLCSITEARMSDVAILGDSYVTTRAEQGSQWDGPLSSADPAQMSILYRLGVASLYRRQYWLGGYPDGVVNSGGQVDLGINPVWSAAVTAYFEALLRPTSTVSAAKMFVKSKAGGVAISNIVLGTVAPDEAKALVSTAPNAHGLAIGGQVKISGVKWFPASIGAPGTINKAPRGTFTVDSANFTPTTFQVKNTLFSGSYDRGGLSEKITRQFEILDYWQLMGAFSRRRGRIFGLPRGRGKIRRVA